MLVFISKNDLTFFQVYPVPKDVENYYSVNISKLEMLEGKKFEPKTRQFIQLPVDDKQDLTIAEVENILSMFPVTGWKILGEYDIQ